MQQIGTVFLTLLNDQSFFQPFPGSSADLCLFQEAQLVWEYLSVDFTAYICLG